MLPKFKYYFYPFLYAIRNGEIYSVTWIKKEVAKLLNLSQNDLEQRTKGGRIQHDDRIKWAITYLKGLGLIENQKKGNWRITSKGIDLLNEYGENLTLDVLRDMKEYKEIAKTDSTKCHWVPGHYRYDGTYVAGYYSSFFAQGIRNTRVAVSKLNDKINPNEISNNR